MVKNLHYKDYSIKARLDNFEAIERKLEELGAQYIGLDKQTDTYFETSQGKLKLRQGNIENLIAHYERKEVNGTERTQIYRYDLNPTQAQMVELIENSKIIGVIRKSRKIYQLQNVKVHLDDTEQGESFIEIEAIDEFNAYSERELEKLCVQTKSNLVIKDDQLVKSGYLKT